MTPQDGFTPHVAQIGNGPRKLLALHCTLAFSGAWGGLARQMDGEITVIAPDMPSHGRSPSWDEQSSFPDTVYKAALDCLTEPMDVIGHSFGGATALRLAVMNPELVRSVTMIEPVFFCVAKEDMPEALFTDRNSTQPVFDLIDQGNMEAAARLFNRSWSEDGPRWPDLPEQVRAAMTRAIHVLPGCNSFLIDDAAGLKPRLTGVQVPSLLVRGEFTEEVVKTTNTGLARRMPNASEAVIPGAGHMAPVTHPAEMAQLLRDFWQSAAQGGSEVRQESLRARR